MVAVVERGEVFCGFIIFLAYNQGRFFDCKNFIAKVVIWLYGGF